MPAKSQKQRAYLAWKFGPEWLRRHHFDNPGKLPTRVANAKTAAQRARAKQKRRR